MRRPYDLPMEHSVHIPYLGETLLFLALSGVLIPFLRRWRVDPVLGFLFAGLLLGPHGFAALAAQQEWTIALRFPNAQSIAGIAELGVIFLMFTIGLEVSFERLVALRRLVFGAGACQVVISALALLGVLWWLGLPRGDALVLALALALSSTAIVMQLLVSQHRLGGQVGRASLSVLLFQDLAVVPILILVSALAAPSGNSLWLTLGTSALKAVALVIVLGLLGRFVLRPAFRFFAVGRQTDSFMALVLLVALGISWATAQSGLSMALGAFLAGLLLAETEYRHEIEVSIEPFRGLLLGVFFLSVGMQLNPALLWAQPLVVLGCVVALLTIKATVNFLIFRGFGLARGPAADGALLLAQSGEFGFVIIAAALAGGLLTESADMAILVIGCTLLLTPLLAKVGRLLERRLRPPSSAANATETAAPEGLSEAVLIAGFGRVGQVIAGVLEREKVPYMALDLSPSRCERLRAKGVPVHLGDASQPALLRHLHVGQAQAIVLTMNDAEAVLHAVITLHRDYPNVPLLARAQDAEHADALRAAGASGVMLETLEAGLQLGRATLRRMGLPEEAIRRRISSERERHAADLDVD